MAIAEYPKYLPVDLDYFEIIDVIAATHDVFKVFYFDPSFNVLDAKGQCIMVEKKTEGHFLLIDANPPVRLDRVITINGKVGPAYEEYDAHANTCLSCLAGYEESKNI